MNSVLEVLKKQWNKRTQREQVLLVAFLFLLTTYLVGNFLILPAKWRHSALKHDLAVLPTEEDVEAVYGQLQKVENQMKELHEEASFSMATGDGKERLVAFQSQMRQDKALILEEMNSLTQDEEQASFPYQYPFRMIYHIPPGQLVPTYQKRSKLFPEIWTTDLSLEWEEDGWIRVDEELMLMSEEPLKQYTMASIKSLGKPDMDLAEVLDEEEMEEVQEEMFFTDDMSMSFSASSEVVDEQSNAPEEEMHETAFDLSQLRYYVNHDASKVNEVEGQEATLNYRLVSRDIPGQLYIALPSMESDLPSRLVAEIDTKVPLKGKLYVGFVDPRGTAVRKMMERTKQTWSTEVPEGYQVRALVYELEIGEGEENQWIIEKISWQE